MENVLVFYQKQKQIYSESCAICSLTAHSEKSGLSAQTGLFISPTECILVLVLCFLDRNPNPKTLQYLTLMITRETLF